MMYQKQRLSQTAPFGSIFGDQVVTMLVVEVGRAMNTSYLGLAYSIRLTFGALPSRMEYGELSAWTHHGTSTSAYVMVESSPHKSTAIASLPIYLVHFNLSSEAFAQ